MDEPAILVAAQIDRASAWPHLLVPSWALWIVREYGLPTLLATKTARPPAQLLNTSILTMRSRIAALVNGPMDAAQVASEAWHVLSVHSGHSLFEDSSNIPLQASLGALAINDICGTNTLRFSGC